MGLLVADQVTLENMQITLQNFYLTIRGSFEIQKHNTNPPSYVVLVRLFWFATQNATQPIHIEMLSFEISDTLDIYGDIYNFIRSRYQNTIDV
jgi:hypothetical protein